jgi:hypothetical protein
VGTVGLDELLEVGEETQLGIPRSEGYFGGPGHTGLTW